MPEIKVKIKKYNSRNWIQQLKFQKLEDVIVDINTMSATRQLLKIYIK